MKRTFLSLLCFSALAFGVAVVEKTAAAPPDADNTARNERDRSGETTTSGDQSNSSEDINITAAIRRAVVKDSSLSMMAQNVKIITANNVVTLVGPVETTAEMTKIEQLAKTAAPRAKIVNQLEVKAAK